jgi:hypothetical protein
MRDSITITREEFDKIARLVDFADWYLDDYPKHMHPEQYENDKEDIVQATMVIQDLCALFETVS